MENSPDSQVNLEKYDNSDYYPGAGAIKRTLWYVVNAFIFSSWLFPSSWLKCRLLVLFGAKIGKGVVIKPRVNIKYPWFLDFGDFVWLGEGVWLDSLAGISIGNNVCISQEAYLLTGNHNYTDPTFTLITNPIVVLNGVWIGARAVVCPGVTMAENSILTVGSVLTCDTKKNGIYSGVPAICKRIRKLKCEN